MFEIIIVRNSLFIHVLFFMFTNCENNEEIVCAKKERKEPNRNKTKKIMHYFPYSVNPNNQR